MKARPRFARARRAPESKPAPEAAVAPSPEELLERLLVQIAQGGRLCREVETRLKEHPGPELETIIKLHRVLVLRLCSEAEAMPERIALVSGLMRPVLEWARLEEKRKQRLLAEQKYHDELAERRAAHIAQTPRKALTPETLEKIERELHLF